MDDKLEYKFLNEKTCDLSGFSQEERNLYDWMKGEAANAKSYEEFYRRTTGVVVENVKRFTGENSLVRHPLYRIHLDLLERVGVRVGEVLWG